MFLSEKFEGELIAQWSDLGLQMEDVKILILVIMNSQQILMLLHKLTKTSGEVLQFDKSPF